MNRKKEERWNTSSGSNSLWVLSNALDAKDVLTEADRVKLKKTFPDMYQSADRPRARVLFDAREDGRAVIEFFRAADASSAPHELYHIFRREMAESAVRPDAPRYLVDGWKRIEAFVGAEPGKPWTRDMEEKFARAGERFLLEGRAPTAELRDVFERLRQWFLNIYRQMDDAGLHISPAMREVFSRMFAVPERNADNDALRGTLTAGDRRALAAATDAALDDIAAARPVDVGEALREAGGLERAYDRVRQDPLGGEPDEVLAAIRPEDIEAVLVHRGPAVMRDGQIVVQGRTLQREMGSKSGYGLVKIIFAHGEGGNKTPGIPAVTREDVISLPRLLRDFEGRIEGDHRVWHIPREDGFALRIVTRHGEEGPGARLVSMYVGPLKEGEEFSRRKPPVASSASSSSRNEDTGRGIDVSHPAGEQGAGHMTDASLPDGAESVKPFAPDYSPAAEAPAPPVETWETPEGARLAEMEELAGQDEALRLGMEELEARGAADADDIAAARTENGDTGALGHEVMDCAWTVEV